jgi:ATP-dependent DNA helicase RecG
MNESIPRMVQRLCADDSENEVVEFKEAKKSYDFTKLGKYFSALSNEANLHDKACGWLIFGVHDKGKTIVGSQFRSNESDLMNLKGEVAKQTTGNLTFSHIYVTELERKRVVVFEIPAAPKGIPIAWQGHFYGRDHEELGALHINELETIRNQVVQSDWSAGICSGASLEDLDPAAITKARKQYALKNASLAEESQSWDLPTFLNKAKLTIDGKVTRTALLLLGKPEASHHLQPAVAQITWILKDAGAKDKDYEHFYSPLLLAIEGVFRKIRMIRYRYMLDDAIFPEEVDQYDPYLIREALNNALAHQDYEKGGRVIVIENEGGSIGFVNKGGFLPGSIEEVVRADAPSTVYRNPFLVAAMVNLNLIDTIGSGIRKMFDLQRKRFFPMPEYDLSRESVSVTVVGKVLDVKYATKLAQMPDLHLHEIMLLDKVQKGKELTKKETATLRQQGLIEGRRPNLHISADVAAQTGQSVDYMKQRGIDTEFCRRSIMESLEKFGEMGRSEFETFLLPKLSENLTLQQKKDRIKNILQALKRESKIEPTQSKKWKIAKQKNS